MVVMVWLIQLDCVFLSVSSLQVLAKHAQRVPLHLLL
jgi:hypothetical protein